MNKNLLWIRDLILRIAGTCFILAIIFIYAQHSQVICGENEYSTMSRIITILFISSCSLTISALWVTLV